MTSVTDIFLDVDAISAYPIELDIVKTFLGIDDTARDSEIERIHIPAAFQWAEKTTRRAIVSRTHRWAIRDFPQTADGRLLLPRGKTQSVTSVAYVSGGTTTTLTGPSSSSPEGTDYQEDLRGEQGGVLMPNRTESWPSVDDEVPVPVLVTFTAGWLADEIPGEVLRAIMWYVGEALDIKSAVEASGTAMSAKDVLLSGWAIRGW